MAHIDWREACGGEGISGLIGTYPIG